jgi:hypothetical protein
MERSKGTDSSRHRVKRDTMGILRITFLISREFLFFQMIIITWVSSKMEKCMEKGNKYLHFLPLKAHTPMTVENTENF